MGLQRARMLYPRLETLLQHDRLTENEFHHLSRLQHTSVLVVLSAVPPAQLRAVRDRAEVQRLSSRLDQRDSARGARVE